jgi:hypothetical protein
VLKKIIDTMRAICPWKAGFRMLILMLLMSAVQPLHAQTLDFGISGGGMYYLGDLNPGKHFSQINIAYGILARYNIDTRWAVKLGATRGAVEGSSANTPFLPDRDLSFSSTITDISAVAEFNFFPYFTGSRRNAISPYLYAGINMFFFDPVSGGVSLRSLGTEGQNIGYQGRKPYSSVGFGVPFGLGVKFSLARALGIQVFWEMHKTFTDYLDDVSTTYYLTGANINPDNPEEVMSDPAMNHTPGMQRGNSKSLDWYSYFGLSVTYKFNLGSKKRCRDLEGK